MDIRLAEDLKRRRQQKRSHQMYSDNFPVTFLLRRPPFLLMDSLAALPSASCFARSARIRFNNTDAGSIISSRGW